MPIDHDQTAMTTEPQTQQARPRKLFTPLVVLAAAYAVELFLSQLLPEGSTRHYSWAGIFWHPTRKESSLYVLLNLTIMVSAARLLTSDLAGTLSARTRRILMLGALCAAGFLGAQGLYGWLIFSYEGGGYPGGQTLPGSLGHTAIVFHGAVAFALLRWMSAQLAAQNRAREAARARMASLALLVAVAARAASFGTGSALPAVALVVGLTAIIYVAYQLSLLGSLTDLLRGQRIEGENAPQL